MSSKSSKGRDSKNEKVFRYVFFLPLVVRPTLKCIYRSSTTLVLLGDPRTGFTRGMVRRKGKKDYVDSRDDWDKDRSVLCGQKFLGIQSVLLK